MNILTLNNPVFLTYIIAASIMILKVACMSWLTVYRMLKVGGGFRSVEDLKRTPLNKNPSPQQVGPNDYVDRIRRIHLNDLENIPFFLVIGLLFVFTGPSLLMAQILFYTYVVTRLIHFFVYLTAQVHDLRAIFWTPGSLIIIYMAAQTLFIALTLELPK